jgi:hypothetical protein
MLKKHLVTYTTKKNKRNSKLGMSYLLLTRANISLPSFKLYSNDNDVLFDVLKSSDYFSFSLSLSRLYSMIQSRKKNALRQIFARGIGRK